MNKTIQRKCITTEVVLESFENNKGNMEFSIIQHLIDKTGAHENVVYSAIRRDVDRGYLDFGVSIRQCWLTEKGKEYLKRTVK